MDETPYYPIYGSQREHIKTLIRWLYEESHSSGGDGNALWYSENQDVKALFPTVEEVNKEMGNFWQTSLGTDEIYWGREQESVTITNNKATWDSRPSWQQVSIDW